MIKTLYYGLLFLLSLSLSSCFLQKKSTGKSGSDTVTTLPDRDTVVILSEPVTDEPVPVDTMTTGQDNRQQADQYLNNRIVFSSFTAKAKCHLENGKEKQDFTANIRIKKDEGIWVSVSAVGGIVQVARLLITPDSVMMLDYLHDKATLIPASEAQTILPAGIDFYVVQDLLIGNIISRNGNLISLVPNGNKITILLEDANYRSALVFDTNEKTMEQSVIDGKSQEKPLSIILDYRSYASYDSNKFSEERMLLLNNEGTQMKLELNYSNVKFDQEVSFPFSVPSKFKINEQ